jgi:IS5 family transposase
MKGKSCNQDQINLVQANLRYMLNPREPLYRLADSIDWDYFEREFSDYYIDFGRPAKPIRLMVSLLILKQLYSISDDEVVEVWTQNPYWQYFSGMDVFQWKLPCVSSDLTHFRKRIGAEGAEQIFQNSIDIHGKSVREKEVLIDSTVMEKNITFPTDVKLYRKIIERCRKIAVAESISLRQSYRRIEKKLLLAQRFRHHPRNWKKARSAERKLKTIAGRLVREIERKMTVQLGAEYASFLERAIQVLTQKRSDQQKIYSLHEPEVYCISKGKDQKRYEFGTKASIVLTKRIGIIVGALNIQNQFDGHSLPLVLEQTERLTKRRPKVAIVDRGYRGEKQVGTTEIAIPKVPGKRSTNYAKQKARQRFRRRAGIEPIIGHLKSDHRMLRNYLKGSVGDDVNILLAAAAFNYKKRLRQLKSIFVSFGFRIKYCLKWIQGCLDTSQIDLAFQY